jgi:hypothetical protein
VHAHLGKAVAGKCLGIALTTASEVSVAPQADGENLGFRDARIELVSEHQELNFLLTPFLNHKAPSSMSVNAADLLRKALQGSKASSGYDVTLDRLSIRSIQIQTDSVVLDVDGSLSVK